MDILRPQGATLSVGDASFLQLNALVFDVCLEQQIDLNPEF